MAPWHREAWEQAPCGRLLPHGVRRSTDCGCRVVGGSIDSPYWSATPIR